MKRMPLALAAVAAALFVACGTGGTPGPDASPDATASPTPTDQSTGAAGDAGADGTGAGSRLAAVSLSFDGQPVPIASACTGADGAVVVTTEGEVTITLVR